MTGTVIRGVALPTLVTSGTEVANRVQRGRRPLRPAREADEEVIGTVPAAEPPPVVEVEAAATLVNSGVANMEDGVRGTGGATAIVTELPA